MSKIPTDVEAIKKLKRTKTVRNFIIEKTLKQMPLKSILKAISFTNEDFQSWLIDDEQFKGEYNLAHFKALEESIDKVRLNTDLKSQQFILNHLDDDYKEDKTKQQILIELPAQDRIKQAQEMLSIKPKEEKSND